MRFFFGFMQTVGYKVLGQSVPKFSESDLGPIYYSCRTLNRIVL